MRSEVENLEASQTMLPVIVCVGASAGGLSAIQDFVANLPQDNGCAYVILQHLSQDHDSNLASMISPVSSIQVLEIKDGTTPKPDYAYVAPPGWDVVLEGTKLHLVPPISKALNSCPSIDRFLKTAAEQCADRAWAIILSGNGSDGAYGVEVIREAGGITIAQDTKSSKFGSMSLAAINTGCIDLVLSPSKMGGHLKKIFTSSSSLPEKREQATRTSPYMSILQIVLAHTHVDFREYKQVTVRRRIERRMTALGITDAEEYANYCRANPTEIDALFKSLLISVTRFFRDDAEFEDIISPIQKLAETQRNGPLRIWIAGCATGEEVYSITILLAEAMGGPANLIPSKVQIFASDIDKAALETARTGRYSPGALFDVPEAFADKYFVQEPDRVRVIDALRSVIVFSEHNLCQDPPYVNMDLICCRNVLIYFENKLQNKVLSRMHFALRPEGYLFLGTAESLTSTQRLFDPLCENARIFNKRIFTKPIPALSEKNVVPVSKPSEFREPPSQSDIAMFDALASSLGDNAILVSQDYVLQKVYGDIQKFISLSKRTDINPTLDILKPPLRQEARGLVKLALTHQSRRIGVRHLSSDPEPTITRLEAIPCRGAVLTENAVLLVINRWNADHINQASDMDLPSELFASDYLKNLDIELANTREALQQTIEKLENSNQELQALSEEMQSTNTELQSANEELGSSNEELQSTNEELITVNEELQFNTTLLQALSSEQTTMLDHLPLPVLVLDSSLQVLRASHSAAELFSISRPVGSLHVSQISLPTGFPPLVNICLEAFENGDMIQEEFSVDSKRFKLKCIPFSNVSSHIIGASFLFLETSMTE